MKIKKQNYFLPSAAAVETVLTNCKINGILQKNKKEECEGK